MLHSLAQWLYQSSPDLGFFRVFQYITFRAVMATITALLVGLAAGPYPINPSILIFIAFRFTCVFWP